MDTTAAPETSGATGTADEQALALLACSQGGMHLLNALRFLGIEPTEIRTQDDALNRVWPTPWAYDVWCAWHACHIVLRRAEWEYTDIAADRRTTWRSMSMHALA